MGYIVTGNKCYNCPFQQINEYYTAKCKHPEMSVKLELGDYQSDIPERCPLKVNPITIKLKQDK